jgi:hypothetical protein
MEWDTLLWKIYTSGVYMILYRHKTEWKLKLKKVMIIR